MKMREGGWFVWVRAEDFRSGGKLIWEVSREVDMLDAGGIEKEKEKEAKDGVWGGKRRRRIELAVCGISQLFPNSRRHREGSADFRVQH